MTWSWSDDTLAALEGFLRNAGLHDGAPDPRPIGDGHSNLTYLIRVRGGRAVLRRPPPPPLPRGANDVLREARVLRALQNSPVPTPRILAVAEAGAVLDVPLYIMEHVPGPVVSTTMPAPFRPERDAPAMAFELVDAMAQLHAVDWRASGLDDFGRPENFNARHLSRLRAVMERREGAVPAFLADTATALEGNVPAESGAAIVHLDFRLGNVIWAPDAPPKLLAVLDWELATIGDPLLDLGYLICCHPEPGEALNPTQELSTALLAPGAPGRAELATHYAVATGRNVEGLSWYAAMAAWKLAVLFEYQHRLGRDPYYADATQAPRFIVQAKRFLSAPMI
jgi:aminoglycoside phosphotransferase (APT) family kinase protein